MTFPCSRAEPSPKGAAHRWTAPRANDLATAQSVSMQDVLGCDKPRDMTECSLTRGPSMRGWRTASNVRGVNASCTNPVHPVENRSSTDAIQTLYRRNTDVEKPEFLTA